MNPTQIILPVIIYLLLFFIIEKVTFKETDKLQSKVIYAVSFSLLIIIFNVFVALGANPPHIAVTVFQIIIALGISIFYIVWQHNKK